MCVCFLVESVQVVAGALAAVVVLALAAVGLIVYRKKTNPSAFSPSSMVSARASLVLPRDQLQVVRHGAPWRRRRQGAPFLTFSSQTVVLIAGIY